MPSSSRKSIDFEGLFQLFQDQGFSNLQSYSATPTHQRKSRRCPVRESSPVRVNFWQKSTNTPTKVFRAYLTTNSNTGTPKTIIIDSSRSVARIKKLFLRTGPSYHSADRSVTGLELSLKRMLCSPNSNSWSAHKRQIRITSQLPQNQRRRRNDLTT